MSLLDDLAEAVHALHETADGLCWDLHEGLLDLRHYSADELRRLTAMATYVRERLADVRLSYAQAEPVSGPMLRAIAGAR